MLINIKYFTYLTLVFCVPGVCSQSVYRLRAQQRSASAAEGQHVHRGVPVHAAHVTPQQVLHAHTAAMLTRCAFTLLRCSPI